MKNDYQHMMIDYILAKVRILNKERNNRIKLIKSKSQVTKYQQEVRKKIIKSFSPFPEKTPLNLEITGIIKKKGYRIEKIIFESRPGCLVTANFYVPEKFNPPYPAVIGTCGHSMAGKAEPRYQEFCQRLVHNGFLVFIYDPFNQGERDQYYHLPKNTILRKSCTTAHNMMGKQLQRIGEFFGSWRVWDGIRALDYILTRQETDRRFLGITGNSGGGTLTCWLWAVEPRFTAAAPSCFITPFRYNLENEMPQDVEQCPPEILGQELELADFFISRIPKPLLLLGQKYDYFDIRGFKEICQELKNLYKILDAENSFDFFIGSNPHGYYSDAQRAMVSFFCRLAKKEIVCPEPPISIERPETLFATKNGNVISEGSKPIYLMIGEKAKKLEKIREKPPEKELRKQVKEIMKIPDVSNIPHYRILRPYSARKSIIARYAIETENGIWVIIKKKAKKPDYIYNFEIEKEITICLPDISSEDEILKKRKFLPLCPEYFVDVRGIGESMPEEKKNFFRPYGYDYMIDRYFFMLGKSYLGMRIYDVLSVIELFKAKGCKKINLYGHSQGAIIGLFVCLFSDSIEKVFLNNLPQSFHSLASVPSTNLPSVNFPEGILRITDIPEILKIIRKHKEVRILQR